MKLYLDKNNHIFAIADQAILELQADQRVVDFTGDIPSDYQRYRYLNGALVEKEEAAAERLTAAREDALNRCRKFARQARARAAHFADTYQLAGWNDKAQRARRILTGTPSDKDLAILQNEITARGKDETAEQLAGKQSDKAQALADAMAVIDGLESSACQAIAAAPDAAALEAVLQKLQQALQERGI